MTAQALPAEIDPQVLRLLQRLVTQSEAEASGKRTDAHAGRLIQEFLDMNGWSARDLAAETELVARRKDKPTMTTSRKTIDRVLDGHVPHARAKAAIALVMGIPPWKIWGEGQMPLAHQREQIIREAVESA